MFKVFTQLLQRNLKKSLTRFKGLKIISFTQFLQEDKQDTNINISLQVLNSNNLCHILCGINLQVAFAKNTVITIYFIYLLSDKRVKGTIVNYTCHFIV